MTTTEIVYRIPLTAIVHGESGVGKTWLLETMPAPRLILDAETGTKFLERSRLRDWNPMTEAPPENDGTWETCIVKVMQFGAVALAYQWLNSGQHPFRSVGLDSISETQKRARDDISGQGIPEQQDWMQLLLRGEGIVRTFRDLTEHAIKPLEAVVMTAFTRLDDGLYRPFVQGQLQTGLPYYTDVVGYMYAEAANGQEGAIRRRLLVQPLGQFQAKDRTNKLGVVIDDPNIEQMLAIINTPKTEDTP